MSLGSDDRAGVPALLFFSRLSADFRAGKSEKRTRSAPGIAVIVWLFCVATGGNAYAGDVKAGREKALMCQACHGTDGLSKVPDVPNIAAQTEAYLTAQLQAFKSGARKNDSMSVVAQTLSEKDIDDLAAYFSAIEIKVVKVPGG